MPNMFCYQCQETSGKGCTALGACGKTDETACLQDLLIYLLKGLAIHADALAREGLLGIPAKRAAGELAAEALFATVTNTNFDSERIIAYIRRVLAEREKLAALRLARDARGAGGAGTRRGEWPDHALWSPLDRKEMLAKSYAIGIVEETPDEALRSVRQTITFGLKGLSAYAHHAATLGFRDDALFDFLFRALAALTVPATPDELLPLALETGKYTIAAMRLLDRANTETFGAPQPGLVRGAPGRRPGILVSGHDLRDLDTLLRQSAGSGVDIYTNGEMILAQSLPHFRRYPHLGGNYGNAWWRQTEEFAAFGGPVLVTSNCIVPIEQSYAGRIFTTGVAGYPGVPHIEERGEGGGRGGEKDFSRIIELAKTLPPPAPLGGEDFMSGFGHAFLGSVKDKVVALVQSGRIRRFVVMAGCDGRDARRRYYTEKALSLPEDAVILTAGCAKYRYIRQIAGTIDGIPRVLDAGQCSDSYSLLVFAQELAAALGIGGLNDLPLEFDLAWYDQKAVAIVLGLLHLGIRDIRIGPTLPEFLSRHIQGALPSGYRLATVIDDTP